MQYIVHFNLTEQSRYELPFDNVEDAVEFIRRFIQNSPRTQMITLEVKEGEVA